MKKLLITILSLSFIAASCTKTKETQSLDNKVTLDTTHTEADAEIDLLVSNVQLEMKRFAQIIEEEIYTLKIQKDKLNGQPKIELEKTIQELQKEKDIFNRILGELDPYSGLDQNKSLVELDSITDQIQSKIKEIRIKFLNQ